jgi:hypothetical protein
LAGFEVMGAGMCGVGGFVGTTVGMAVASVTVIMEEDEADDVAR